MDSILQLASQALETDFDDVDLSSDDEDLNSVFASDPKARRRGAKKKFEVLSKYLRPKKEEKKDSAFLQRVIQKTVSLRALTGLTPKAKARRDAEDKPSPVAAPTASPSNNNHDTPPSSASSSSASSTTAVDENPTFSVKPQAFVPLLTPPATSPETTTPPVSAPTSARSLPRTGTSRRRSSRKVVLEPIQVLAPTTPGPTSTTATAAAPLSTAPVLVHGLSNRSVALLSPSAAGRTPPVTTTLNQVESGITVTQSVTQSVHQPPAVTAGVTAASTVLAEPVTTVTASVATTTRHPARKPPAAVTTLVVPATTPHSQDSPATSTSEGNSSQLTAPAMSGSPIVGGSKGLLRQLRGQRNSPRTPPMSVTTQLPTPHSPPKSASDTPTTASPASSVASTPGRRGLLAALRKKKQPTGTKPAHPIALLTPTSTPSPRLTQTP